MAEYVGGYCEGPGKIFTQSLFAESATKKHRIGAIRTLDDGRVFAYAQAGAALTAGYLNQAAVPDAYSPECAVQAAAAVGDKHIHITYGAGATATLNYYEDGFLASVMPAYGIGTMYKVRGHAAMTSGATVQVNLYDSVLVALTTDSKVSLTKHVQSGVITSIATTPTGVIAGVSPIAVTSAYYFWNQVKGICNVLLAGNAVVGENLVPGAVAGGLMPHAAVTEVVCGYCIKDATDTYGMLVMLSVPGY